MKVHIIISRKHGCSDNVVDYPLIVELSITHTANWGAHKMTQDERQLTYAIPPAQIDLNPQLVR